MDSEFNIGDKVCIVDCVDSDKVVDRGVVINRWFSRFLCEFIYVVRTYKNAIGNFKGEYLLLDKSTIL